MPVELCKKAYHFTHVDNLSDIARHGLLSHNRIRQAGVDYNDISDKGVQRWRQRSEPVYGRSIHDYVPMYLNPRNPMLYCLREYSQHFVMLAIDISEFTPLPVVFADGNAACADTRFGSVLEAAAPAMDALRASSWNAVPDGKRHRCAEMLVPDRIPVSLVDGIYSMNNAIRDLAHRILGREVHTDTSLFFP